MKNLKNNKGITLIALVITIVVLIIITGISVYLAIGDNGILTKTKIAKEMTLNSQIEENTVLTDYESKVDEFVSGSNRENNGTVYIEEFTYTESSYYKKWSNGVIEQGGYFLINGNTGGWSSYTFPKSFPNKTITVQLTGGCGSSGWQYANGNGLGSISNTSFGYTTSIGSSKNTRVEWYAIGY